MMKRFLTFYLSSWWLPSLLYLLILGGFILMAIPGTNQMAAAAIVLLCTAFPAFCGLIAASIWNLKQKHWGRGIINLIFVLGLGAATLITFGLLIIASSIGPTKDGFADALTIPDGIEISEPEEHAIHAMETKSTPVEDELQASVRRALASTGDDVEEFTPEMPSLKKAATDHARIFHEYIEASPDWHVFMERGNRFASRRWSYEGEPRNTLHGYISEFSAGSGFQTRCLLCLDLKQWSTYSVQHVMEGSSPVKPNMTRNNNLHESRVMIECGGVWVEIFEQSDKPERRVTKATLAVLEKEFSEFVTDPAAALESVRGRSRALAIRVAGKGGHQFRLLKGMQPGIYDAIYLLNPGEPGSVYLKAFEVTKSTPLSVGRLESASRTRMAWSTDPSERFGARAGFTIYEGDWGKPYAARFEVWFKSDAGKTERMLADRIFKIEGWQR